MDDSATLWHGRFAVDPATALRALNDSLSFDRRMFREDIAGSRAHAAMLASVGLISEAERDAIFAALDEVEAEMAEGRFVAAPGDEDIHTAVERRVTEITPAGAKLHTGRSRNDQVAADLRLWTRGRAGRCRPGRAGAAADASGQGCRRRRGAAARLHPSAAGSAGPAGPSPAGPRLGAGPRRSTGWPRPAAAPTCRLWGRGRWPGRRCRWTPAGLQPSWASPRSSTTASTRWPTATSWPTPSMRWLPSVCI